MFDHNMIGRIVATQQHFHRRDEFIRHRAADTSVGQFNDVVSLHVSIPQLQNITIDAQITKSVDDQRNTLALAFRSVPDKRGFTRAEKNQ
jgi:hypothetical protein